MADPVLPTIIAGPAIVTLASYSFYTESGIMLTPERESFDVSSDADGKIDTRHKSLLNMIELTPVGEIESMAKYFPYGAAQVGKSIFGTANAPLVIVTKFGGAANTGQTRTFPRGAIFKPPQLRLSTQKTLFGSSSPPSAAPVCRTMSRPSGACSRTPSSPMRTSTKQKS